MNAIFDTSKRFKFLYSCGISDSNGDSLVNLVNEGVNDTI